MKLRAKAKPPSSPTRHHKSPSPVHSLSSSPLGELPAHTTAPQTGKTINISGGEYAQASFGTAGFGPQCWQLILTWCTMALVSFQHNQDH